MKIRVIRPGLILFLFLGSAFHAGLKIVQADSFADTKTLVLYDAASGTIPSESLMDFTDFPPGAAALTYSDGAAVLDTTQSVDTFAGWVSGQAISSEFPILDRTTGVQVNFSLLVNSETHNREHRAGFSLILLDQDAKGIELDFWENEIWAQNDTHTGGLFTHGEGTAFSTTTNLTDYQLNIVGDTYTLSANSVPILSGPIRDYSGFEGFPDPYETPNFLFLGDNTRAAQARIRLRYVSVTGTQPMLASATVQSSSPPNSPPTASFTPLPSETPIASPTPTQVGKGFEFCPSGWLLMAMMIPAAIMTTQRRRRKNPS